MAKKNDLRLSLEKIATHLDGQLANEETKLAKILTDDIDYKIRLISSEIGKQVYNITDQVNHAVDGHIIDNNGETVKWELAIEEYPGVPQCVYLTKLVFRIPDTPYSLWAHSSLSDMTPSGVKTNKSEPVLLTDIKSYYIWLSMWINIYIERGQISSELEMIHTEKLKELINKLEESVSADDDLD